MYYSTYRNVTVTGYVIVIVLVGALLVPISLGTAIGFVAAFLVIGLIGAAVNLHLVKSRLDDYGGRIPMPNAGLGLWGVDIVDDRDGVDDDGTDGEPPSELPTVPLEGSKFTPHCPYCHAELTKPGQKYCHECGKPLATY